MITDKIKNIDKYEKIPKNIREFIKTLKTDLPAGRINIDENNYANIDEYTTKPHQDCLFEGHKLYTDIQIILNGIEQIDYASSDDLTIKTPYDATRDVEFFNNPKYSSANVVLDGSNFVVLTSEEAHKPQVAMNECPQKVKKVVVKILE